MSGCGVCAVWRARHAAHTPQYRVPDDGLHGPKRVGVTVKKCFNVNFNIYMLNKRCICW